MPNIKKHTDETFEAAKKNWVQVAALGAMTALLSGGVSMTSHNATEGAEKAAIERIERELAELDDLDDELDDLRQRQREETRERARMIREVIRDLRREMNDIRAGVTVASNPADYYLYDAPAAAMEAAPTIVEFEEAEPAPEPDQ